MEPLINQYSALGYVLEVEREALVARAFRVLKTGRKQKIWGYRFKNMSALIDYAEKYYKDIFERIEQKKHYKEEQKLKKARERDGVSVGDVFCYSWGWEQTNIDFYQVVEKLSNCFVMVRPIHCISIETTSWGSDRVKADIDAFSGEAEKVKLCGESFVRSCGHAYKVKNPKTESFHRSWYA